MILYTKFNGYVSVDDKEPVTFQLLEDELGNQEYHMNGRQIFDVGGALQDHVKFYQNKGDWTLGIDLPAVKELF